MTILNEFLSRDEEAFVESAAADIFKHYGESRQLGKLEEECAELIAALARCTADGSPSDEHQAQAFEELADVILMIQQIVGAMGPKTGRYLANIVMQKAHRQLDRISAEKDAASHRDPAHGC